MIRKHPFLFIVSLWCTAALFTSCVSVTTNTNTNPPPQTENSDSSQHNIEDYYPLRVGDRRVYRIRYGQSQEAIQRSVKITKKQGVHFFDDQRGSYKVDAYGLQADNVRYLLKFPLRKGNQWLSVTGVTSVERYTIIDTNRTVTVPAGTYTRCIVVHSRQRLGPQGTLEAFHFYAPQIGPIKIATTLRSQNRLLPQWNLELVAYFPSKAPSQAASSSQIVASPGK